jgi:hypothetical protein
VIRTGPATLEIACISSCSHKSATALADRPVPDGKSSGFSLVLEAQNLQLEIERQNQNGSGHAARIETESTKTTPQIKPSAPENSTKDRIKGNERRIALCLLAISACFITVYLRLYVT